MKKVENGRIRIVKAHFTSGSKFNVKIEYAQYVEGGIVITEKEFPIGALAEEEREKINDFLLSIVEMGNNITD